MRKEKLRNYLKLVFLTTTLSVLLIACGNGNSESDNNSPTNQKNDSIQLVANENNTVKDYSEFKLFKISTGKKITASVGGGIFYENNNSSETFVDIILDWTNTGSETVSCEDIVVATATNKNGTEYTNCIYTIETDNAKDLSRYENITPLSQVRLHCSISVPENETELALKLLINGTEYIYDYSLNSVVNNAKELKVGDVIEETNYATLVFNGIEYTDDLLPPNTSGAYTHYPIDNNSNTYLVAKFDITNYMSDEKDCDTFVGIRALYMEKYTYTGFVVVEDEDGKGFGKYEDIAPLSTRHFYYLIEVPKTVTENEVVLTFSFNGKEYIYTGK